MAVYSHSNLVADLPAQMVPLSQKDDSFKEECMNALEAVGRAQYNENLGLIENYEMVRGKFIYSHYFETEGYSDFMAQLTREFELPSYLRHYDIISQVINTLLGEYEKRPDIFRVKDYSEEATNEFERTKTDMIQQYVIAQINAEVTGKLLQRGIDPNKSDFASQEEMQQYQQMVEQARQSLTPVEIQKYMETEWQYAAEMWGQHQMELDKARYNLKEKEKREFEDMLVADRCFRHYYLTPTGYNQETWNPIQVFFQKSPDVEYVEDGDYVGRVYHLSIPAIIDRFGHLMKKDDLEALEDDYRKRKEDKRWNYTKGTEWVYQDNTVPFQGFQVYDTLAKTQGVPKLDVNFLDVSTTGRYYADRKGLFMVTEGYWKTQEKLGKVTYIDPQTGVKISKLVDETFVVPPHFTVIDAAFGDSSEEDTIVWTWINRVWKGIKINMKGSISKDLFLDIGPVDFQFKGDLNPYDAKLPVCGQIFSPRNSKSMSLVDLMKPYQIFYNVAMNQLYQVMEREIGRFVVMDINMFPDAKDWGGEKSWEKFMLVARELGLAPADTSPQNLKGAAAAAGGYLPKDFNFDDSQRMMSRMSLAEKFEQLALRQVGFNQYRLGAYSSEATAAGVQAGQQTSYAQTDSYFTNFSNYLRRCYGMDLAIAQYVQAKNIDVSVMNIKSDMSRSFIKILGTDLLLSDLHVYVLSSPEYMRQLDLLRQLAIKNNTAGASMLDLAEIITADSPAEIKIKLKEAAKKMEEQQQQQQQIEQQKIDQDHQAAMLKIQKDEEALDKKLQNNLDVAYINHGTKILTQPNQVDNSSDIKSRQMDLQAAQNESKGTHDQQKLELQKQKDLAERDYKNKSLALQQANIQKDLQVQREKLAVVQTMKDKTPNSQ